MIATLNLKNTSNECVPITVKQLDPTYLDQIMALQDQIYSKLEEKSWYSCTPREEFQEYMDHTGYVVGCVTPDNELIALGVYVKPGLHQDNYGYDLDLSTEDLLKVGHIEITIVKETYRGNRLQQYLCHTIETIAQVQNTPIIMATVCPENIYSLNTLLKLGFKIKKEKIKYGGLKRYIMMKSQNALVDSLNKE